MNTFRSRSRLAAWWKRTRVGEYMRPMGKDDPELEIFLRENRLRRR